MRRLKLTIFAISLCAALRLSAQDSTELALAKKIDQEILKLRDLPEDAQPATVKDLARRIRQQPKEYALALAFNLSVDTPAACGREALQEVTTTLAGALRNSPARYRDESQYLVLAELARYSNMEVSLDQPMYAAALSRLEANDRHRNESDFTLRDLQGKHGA